MQPSVLSKLTLRSYQLPRMIKLALGVIGKDQNSSVQLKDNAIQKFPAIRK